MEIIEHIELKHDDQPILIEEVPKRRKEDEKVVVRYLIPELCYLTGIDELTDQERADIITKSKFQPSEKVKKIEQGFDYLKNKTEKKC